MTKKQGSEEGREQYTGTSTKTEMGGVREVSGEEEEGGETEGGGKTKRGEAGNRVGGGRGGREEKAREGHAPAEHRPRGTPGGLPVGRGVGAAVGAAGGVGVGGGVGEGRPHSGVARSTPCPRRRMPPLPPLPPWLATTAASVRPKRRLPPATGATVAAVGDEATTTDVPDVEVRVVAAGDYAGAPRVAAPTGRGGTAQAQRKDKRAVEAGGVVGVAGGGRGRPWRPSRYWDHQGRG